MTFRALHLTHRISKEAHTFWASLQWSSTLRMATSLACQAGGLSTPTRLHSSPQRALETNCTPTAPCMTAGSPRTCSNSGSRVGGGPRSHSLAFLLLGDCPACCLIEGLLQMTILESWKVTCFCGLVRLGLGEWVCLPLESLWESPPARVLVHLWHHPHNLLLKWPQLWEHWQSPCFILVANWLSLLILSLSQWVATSTHQWASLALASSWL